MKKWILPIFVLLLAIIVIGTVLEVTGIIHLRGLLLNSAAASTTFGPLIRTYQLGIENSEELANATGRRNSREASPPRRTLRSNGRVWKEEEARAEQEGGAQQLIQAWDERHRSKKRKRRERLEKERFALMRPGCGLDPHPDGR